MIYVQESQRGKQGNRETENEKTELEFVNKFTASANLAAILFIYTL